MKYAALLLGIVILGFGANQYRMHRLTAHPPSDCPSTLTLTSPNQTQLYVELATTHPARMLGLAKRSTLAPRSGMLFLFPTTAIHPFWMKDTHIPLDIIWLHDKTVVEIASLEPATDRVIPEHVPTAPANQVLELNRGESATAAITVGSQLEWTECDFAIR